MGLSAEACATALEDAGLVELSGNRQFYTETGQALALSSNEFEARVQSALKGTDNGKRK